MNLTAERFASTINEHLQKRVGLRRLYPFSVAKGLRCTAYADIVASVVVMASDAHDYNTRRIEAIYLHEVGHLIAASVGIDDDPSGRTHNRFFACLVAVMYRRAGLMDRLTLYDFADTHERQGALSENQDLPPNDELVERFSYIICRSAQLAPLPLTIEQVAALIYREDCERAWLKLLQPPRKVSRWRSWLGLS